MQGDAGRTDRPIRSQADESQFDLERFSEISDFESLDSGGLWVLVNV